MEVVFGVAILLAALFAAWTPGSSRPEPPPEGDRPASLPATLPPGQPTSTPRGPLLIGIVAGHWKNDSGAVCPDGLTEADLNLTVATLVQKALAENGYQVDLLAEFDPRLAGYQADALVSIHADSCLFINTDATGYKVASAMATRNPERAARLTACLRARYGQATNLRVHSTSVTPDMTSYHAFDEIDENTPAAIIETGFLNLDGPYLVANREQVAQGIVDGILCFLKNESIVQPLAPVTPPVSASPTP